ncbi:glycoside hydrolase family 31 protein [Mucilaginibacter sp. UR6-1]|uniref:glycoside hydrolase family 31 protein n=1 Tax=Mucilaginibacter sp. UR6-1 TaxID=1435643 RepID=UPI001E3574D6|nr:TIM-barrel domain-containing protein [Mucilaginibacter sp. UR6-1]MCC8407778.1 glycoside hydrolase family 31 protein [Mucilaginibacter sp. UR6-1]
MFSILFLALTSSLGSAQQIRSWSKGTHQVTIAVNGGYLVVAPMSPSAVRIRFTKNSAMTPASMIFPAKAVKVAYSLTSSSGALTIKTSKLVINVSRKDGAITFTDLKGKIMLREMPGARKYTAGKVQGEDCMIAEQKFISPKDEYLYGMGQFQDGILNIKNLPRRQTQVNTQISIPFITSSKGYSLLWHNYGLTDFNPADSEITLQPVTSANPSKAQTVDVTTTNGSHKETRRDKSYSGTLTITNGDRYSFLYDSGVKMAGGYYVEIDGKRAVDFKNHWLPPTTSWFQTLSPGVHTFKVIASEGDKPRLYYRKYQDETVFRSPVAEAVDYVFFAGKADAAIGEFRRLSGNAPLMPVWALGYIHCRERFHSQQEILGVASEFRKRNIPMDLIVQDWEYWGKYGWNAMRFDETDYPDPKKMVDSLHAMNTRLMVSVWSRIDKKSEIGKDFSDRNFYVSGTDWVDFFNPEAASLYWKYYRERMYKLGIDAWWQDATEPENDDLLDRKVNNGTVSGERVRNIFPLLVSKTVYEGSRAETSDKRVLILSRSGFSGIQRYGVSVWSGDVGNDWETLRRQLAAGLNYMASGMPWWTFDAGGFFRPADQYTDPRYHERFARWMQLATFSPLQRVHGYQTNTEFWNYGPEVVQQSLKYLRLRYRLLPYIYTQNAAVSFKGGTLMRPLVMDFPEDQQALEAEDQYMFGPSLLVAPVMQPSVTTRKVYLPENAGGWFDFWTGRRLNSKTRVNAAADVSTIPLFVKAGSIIPFGPDQQYTQQVKNPVITLRIYPGADADFNLYEDDGESYHYEKGAYSVIPIHWDDRNGTLTLGKRKGSFPGMAGNRLFKIEFISTGAENALRKQYAGNAMKLLLR